MGTEDPQTGGISRFPKQRVDPTYLDLSGICSSVDSDYSLWQQDRISRRLRGATLRITGGIPANNDSAPPTWCLGGLGFRMAEPLSPSQVEGFWCQRHFFGRQSFQQFGRRAAGQSRRDYDSGHRCMGSHMGIYMSFGPNAFPCLQRLFFNCLESGCRTINFDGTWVSHHAGHRSCQVGGWESRRIRFASLEISPSRLLSRK